MWGLRMHVNRPLDKPSPKDAMWIVLVTSTNALAYNVVHYLTIQITSAVTTTVLGMVRRAQCRRMHCI